MITIHPQDLTLSKLLDGRLFRIPEYQRAYSWTSRERQDLFGDIEKIHDKGQDVGHFMAAVVCLRRDKQTLGTDEFHVLEVVDGQQRLTTLIILLNTIKLALNRKDKAEAKLARELSELLVKVEGEELLLLQTNHDSSHYFATFLRKGTFPTSASASATTLADREILRAIGVGTPVAPSRRSHEQSRPDATCTWPCRASCAPCSSRGSRPARMTAATWGCCPGAAASWRSADPLDLWHVHADRAAAERCGVLLGGAPDLVRLDEVRPAVYCVAW